MRANEQLLGLAAYESLRTFEVLASQGGHAPGLKERTSLGGFAAAEYERFQHLSAELEAHGLDVVEAMLPYQDAIDSYYSAVATNDWPEAMLKVCLTAGLTAEFGRGAGPHLGVETVRLLGHGDVAGRTGDYAADQVEDWLAGHPDDTGRLVLLGRRISSEVVSQAQRVATRDADLGALVTGSSVADGSDLEAVAHLLERLVDANMRRLHELGLLN